MENDHNTEKCFDMRSQIDSLVQKIESYRSEISYLKQDINALDNEIRHKRSDMKNKMTSYGVSRDFVADAFVPNPVAAIAKGTSDFLGASSAREIENLMDEISEIKDRISGKESEIMGIGREINALTREKEDLVAEWRYLGCGRRRFR